MKRILAVAFLLSSIGAAQGQSPPITTYNLDNVLYVDGVKYALSAAGIQQAINDAVSAGGTKVILPPGTINMGGTTLLSHSRVCLQGAGDEATILSYSSSTAGIDFADTTGTTGACVRDLQLYFTTAAGNSTAIRIHGYNDGVPTNTFYFNTFENIRIQFQTLTSESAGIYATSDGSAAATQVFLNHFRNIRMWGVDWAVICNGCEGNDWEGIQAYKSGIAHPLWQYGVSTAGAPNADEKIDFRGENETGTASYCLYLDGAFRFNVKLTCDSGVAGMQAIFETAGTFQTVPAGYNIFDVVGVGSPTLGTVLSTSQYRFANATSGSSQLDSLTTNGLIGGGAAARLTGTGACATITTQTGGSWAGSARCTGTGGASTLTIAPGTTAPHGWICSVQDETTSADLFRQTTHTTTTCTLSSTWVTSNDALVFSALAF